MSQRTVGRSRAELTQYPNRARRKSGGCWSEHGLCSSLYGSKLMWGRSNTRGTPMDRRTFLLGLLGGLAVPPTIIAATSSVEAASAPEAASPSPLTEADR